MTLSAVIWGVIGFLLTVMILSYLIKDSLLFRLAAYLLIGLTAGYLVVLLVNRVLLPHLIWPMAEASWSQRFWLLIPIVLGLLLLIGQVPRLAQLSRIPLAYLAWTFRRDRDWRCGLWHDDAPGTGRAGCL